jgi:hypothetical protein
MESEMKNRKNSIEGESSRKKNFEKLKISAKNRASESQ